MASNSGKGQIPTLRILTGLPGSGKTTEAKEWVEKDPNKRVRINWDDLRAEMFGEAWRFNRQDENKMQAESALRAENAIKLGMSVVIDNTNLTSRSRQHWIDLATRLGADHEVDEIDTDIWTCIERDNGREGKARVGRAVIERMALFNGMIDWKCDTAYPYEGFIICDLDGTLCEIDHRRHFVANGPPCPRVEARLFCDGCGYSKSEAYYASDATYYEATCERAPAHIAQKKKDWKSFFANVHLDTLNEYVADMLDTWADDGMGILLVSGRPIDQCGIATQDWLAENKVRYDHLFMRAANDSRSDVIVKQEILDLLPKQKIDYVLDDRNSVVKMWRDNGLFCLQVADGDF